MNIVPVETTIKQGQLRWLRHLMRMQEGTLIKQVFEAKEPGKKKGEDQEKPGKKYELQQRGEE